MSEELIGSTRFSTAEHPTPAEYYLYKNDFEKIVEIFSKNKKAYAAFKVYCEDWKNDNIESGSHDPFREELVSSIDQVVGYGRAFYVLVLEELMKSHGVQVNWR